MTEPTPTTRRGLLAGSATLVTTALAAAPASSLAGSAATATSTSQVLEHHLGAFAQGLDALMADYAKNSVILSRDKQYRGPAEIRAFFDAFLKGVKPGFWEAFKITDRAIDRDVAYLVWEARPFVTLATDTLVVRGGKIQVQTFTAA